MTIFEAASLVTPLLAVLIAAATAGRWGWRYLDRRAGERHVLINNKLDAIEQHLCRLNGYVEEHSRQIAKLEGAVFMLQERDG